MTSISLQLHQLVNEKKRFSFPFKQIESEIPKNGIYFLFEKGENLNHLDRIVRVGTHTGNNQLHSRLKQHFIRENKNRSIFRKNIGRCILNKEYQHYLPLWELNTTSKADKEKNLKLLDLDFEKQVEMRISEYIQSSFTFCVIRVDEKVDRLSWESKLISTLAKSNELKPSEFWLGNFSTKYKIKQSGLWQVNELYKQELTEQDLNDLKKMIS